MAEPTRTLRRLPQQGKIAGVCAGLAEYINMDVTLVRVIFIILAFITGGGLILIYILMAIVMPSEGAKKNSKGSDINQNIQTLADDMRTNETQNRVRNFIGLSLIVLGIWLFLGQLFPGLLDRGWDYVWPVALILLGVYIATRRASRDE